LFTGAIGGIVAVTEKSLAIELEQAALGPY
jgi:hypothetical protein